MSVWQLSLGLSGYTLARRIHCHICHRRIQENQLLPVWHQQQDFQRSNHRYPNSYLQGPTLVDHR